MIIITFTSIPIYDIIKDVFGQQSPTQAIGTMIPLKETGPAVSAMFVLRVLRAPKGVLSLNDTAIFSRTMS